MSTKKQTSKPIHPGEFIKQTFLEPHNIGIRELARNLGVAPSTAFRVVSCESSVTPEMALRLSKTLGQSPESWLQMQQHYDLFMARKNIKSIKANHLKCLAELGGKAPEMKPVPRRKPE